MNKEKPIGVFDSGIGGVTILKEILKILPNEDYVYYSDSINNPYGDRSKSEIISICKNNVDFLLNKNCKIIVVACNTACTSAINSLREAFPDIKFVGIEPAYKMVHDCNPDEETLVMATKGTIESERFNFLYHKYDNHKTHLLSCVGLADIIEEGNEEKLDTYLKDNIKEYGGKVKNIVLGCTHYPLIVDKLKSFLGEVRFFEGSNRVAVHLKEVLEEEGLLNLNGTSKIDFTDSSNSELKKERFFKILN